jgi:hypothetical protein
MMTEAQNFAAVRTELDAVLIQNFDFTNTTPSIATATTAALFKQMPFDRQAFIEEIFKGGGVFPQIGETGIVSVTDTKIANKLITPILAYADSRDLSKDWFDDQMHNLYQETIADMALMARVTQDVAAFSIFRGAFTTTLTADGAPMIGTHTLLNGQSYSNALTPAALSPDSLNLAIVALRQQPNQNGVVLGNEPAYLVVPSKLLKHAIEITQSALVADSANNNVNVYRSVWGFEIYSSPYLDNTPFTPDGSDTAWFLLARNHKITRLVRQGLQTFLRDWGFSNNRTYNYQANFREAYKVADYIGTVGNVGA